MKEARFTENNGRIAIFSDPYRPKLDGVSVSIENTVKRFDAIGVDYHLFVPKSPGAYVDNESTFRLVSVPIVFQPELRWSFPVGARAFNALLKSRYGLVHSHSPGPMGVMAWAVAKMARIPHFHTFHTFLPDYTHYVFNGRVITPDMATRLSIFWVNHMDYIIVPSIKVKRWLTGRGASVSIRVIPNGIDLSRFSPPSSDVKRNYLVEHGLAHGNEFVALFVGRLGKEKAVAGLLEGFAGALSSGFGERMRLVIVGDGPDKGRLVDVSSRLGIADKVTFAGYISPAEMPFVYRSASVLTFLSRSETQGMVVAEALACGLPVIVADDSAFDEMVTDGQNGFLVSDGVGFIRSLPRVVENENLRDGLSKNAALSAAKFGIDKQVDTLLAFYEESLSEWRSSVGLVDKIKARMSIGELRERSMRLLRGLRGILERGGSDV